MPTGFSVVGRLSLPIPLPPRHIFFYELGKGVTIRVGTVSPRSGKQAEALKFFWIRKWQPYKVVLTSFRHGDG